jgi:hypothetical protein
MLNSELYILTFVITGLWDVVLRFMSLNFNKLPKIVKQYLPFIEYLQPYFEKHTLLAAALVAAFVGATTQVIIVNMVPFPKRTSSYYYVFKFMLISFIVSALYGFVMKFSKLFPRLDETYYKRLEEEGGVIRSMYHDGISGWIVQFSILFLVYIRIFK